MSEEAIKRFEITVERRLIIYAPDKEAASASALDALGFRKRPGSGSEEEMPIKVVGVTELPALIAEKRVPIIDRAPSRETQK